MSDVRYRIAECSLGQLLVAQNPRGICAVLLGDDRTTLLQELRDWFPGARPARMTEGPVLAGQVVARIDSPAREPDPPLDLRGTAFQRRVWQALRRIPPGSTATYGDIARRIGMPGSARAVGRACATNRLAVLVPCHRAVRSDGGLAGYRWGVQRKRILLEREAT
jgi:AraC family transcriptional regulator of adaptative response/methylated-DNA-[protein]-cysteine methyltransferase